MFIRLCPFFCIFIIFNKLIIRVSFFSLSLSLEFFLFANTQKEDLEEVENFNVVCSTVFGKPSQSLFMFLPHFSNYSLLILCYLASG